MVLVLVLVLDTHQKQNHKHHKTRDDRDNILQDPCSEFASVFLGLGNVRRVLLGSIGCSTVGFVLGCYSNLFRSNFKLLQTHNLFRSCFDRISIHLMGISIEFQAISRSFLNCYAVRSTAIRV